MAKEDNGDDNGNNVYCDTVVLSDEHACIP